MACYPGAPYVPPEPTRRLHQGMMPAATSSALPASVASSPFGQAFVSRPCDAGSSVYVDQFGANLDGQLNAADALASVQMSQGAVPYIDDLVAPPSIPEHRAFQKHCQQTEFNSEMWNRGTDWPVRSSAGPHAPRGQRDHDRVTPPRDMKFEGTDAREPFFSDAGCRTGFGRVSDGSIVQHPFQQQQRPSVPLYNSMKFDPSGYAPFAETQSAFHQQPYGCSARVHALGAPQQRQIGFAEGCAMEYSTAPNDVSATWFGDQGNLRQEEPRKFDSDEQCMFRALGTRVYQPSAGHNGLTIAASAAESQRREAAYASQNFLATSGLGIEPNLTNSIHYAPTASSASATSIGPRTKPRDTMDLICEMTAYVFDESPVVGHRLPHHDREGATHASSRRYSQVAGVDHFHEQYPFQLPEELQPLQAAPVPLPAEADAMGWWVVVNLPNSDLHGRVGQVVGYDNAAQTYRIHFSSGPPPSAGATCEPPSSTGDMAHSFVATHAGSAPLKGKPMQEAAVVANSLAETRVREVTEENANMKDRYRVKNRALAKHDVPDTVSSSSARAKNNSERENDTASEKRGVANTNSNHAASARSRNRMNKSSPSEGDTSASTCADTGAKVESVEQVAFKTNFRARVQTKLLGAMHLEDLGVGPSVDSSGVPLFLRELRQKKKAAEVALQGDSDVGRSRNYDADTKAASADMPSPPPEDAVPVPHLG